MKYDAFISYSHTTGWRLATEIQGALQEIAKPWNKAKALNIFRDETNLGTSPHLWGDIESALNESKHFILLCTPEAATSQWVSKEIRHWLNTKTPETIHFVWLNGDWEMDDVINEINWSKTNALPLIFKEHINAIPNYLDLRKYRDVSELNIKRNPAFKADLLKLASAIHGKTVEELDSKHIREYKKGVLLRTIAYTLLSMSAIAIIGFSLTLVKRNAELASSRDVLKKSNISLKKLNTELEAANISIVKKEAEIRQNRDSLKIQLVRNIKLNDSLRVTSDNLKSQIDYVVQIIEKTMQNEVNWQNAAGGVGKAADFKPRFATLYLEFDKTRLKSTDLNDMNKICDFLREYPGVNIEIAGYNHDYTSAYSEMISQRNSKGLADYIRLNGIAPERISMVSYGNKVSEFPVDNPDKRIQHLLKKINRKLEIRLVAFPMPVLN